MYCDGPGITVLVAAIYNGSEDVVRVLIHLGADTVSCVGGVCLPLEKAKCLIPPPPPGVVRMIRDPKTHANGCVDCALEAVLKAQTLQITAGDLCSSTI